LEAIGAAIATGRRSFAFVDEMFVDHTRLTGRTFREIAGAVELSAAVPPGGRNPGR
jgi:hypothetical protein